MTEENKAAPSSEDNEVIRNILDSYQKEKEESPKAIDSNRSSSRPKRDNSSFQAAYKKIEEKYSSFSEYEDKVSRESSLKKWLDSLPEIYKDSNVESIDEDVILQIKKALNGKKKGVGALYFYGKSVTGKTWAAYAIIRSMVSKGVAKPSRILVIDESDIRSLSYKDFQTKQRFLESLKRDIDVFLVDDVSDRVLDDRQEDFYRELLKSIYNKSKNSFIIFTSNISPKEWINSIYPDMEGNIKAIIGKYGVIHFKNTKIDVEPIGWSLDSSSYINKTTSPSERKKAISEAFSSNPKRRKKK